MKQQAFDTHQHEHCIHDALAAAETLCVKRGVRLTAIRKRVLELVWASHPAKDYWFGPQIRQVYDCCDPDVG